MDEPVQKRTRVSRDEWAKRVERWRDSGLTTAEFAAELGINPHSVTYWAWALKREAGGKMRVWAEEVPQAGGGSEGRCVEHAVRGGEEPHAARAVRARKAGRSVECGLR